jgi:hypothetical protein
MIKFFRKIRQKLLSENPPDQSSRASKLGMYLLYAIGEIALVMIGILLALQVNNWNDEKNSKISEQKILSEISNGIWRDLSDFEGNVYSNKKAIKAGEYFINYISKNEVSLDSLNFYYSSLFKDYSPVINKSGYESLKSNGLKTISDDSMRFQIVELYDYYYTIIENNTAQQAEELTFTNYSGLIKKLYPFMEFDNNGQIISASKPLLDVHDQKELTSYLQLVKNRREYVLKRYKKVIENMKKLSVSIDKHLGKYTPPQQLEAYLGTYQKITNENLIDNDFLSITIENNYLLVYSSLLNYNRSYYMIAPDEFESLILLYDQGDKLKLKFDRDDANVVSGITLFVSNRTIKFKKIN